jgi:hypothetical protein
MEHKGKWRQATSQVFLYQCFRLLFETLKNRSEVAALSLSGLLGLPLKEGYDPVQFVLDLVLVPLRKQLEKERDTFQKTRAEFLMECGKGLQEQGITDLRELNQIQMAFMKDSPVMGAVGRLLSKASRTVIALRDGTEDEIIQIILNKDLVGCSVNMEVFAMRPSKAKILAAATLVKPFIRS